MAKPGDIVQVFPGTYEGPLILDKPIVLQGIGSPTLRGTGQGSVLVVLADECTIKGFVIEHSGGDLQSEDSGILLKSSGNHVEDNQLRDVLFGIYLYHSRANTIRHNLIRGRSELQLGERGAGLHLWNSANNVIEQNDISDARDGMYIQSSPGNVIRHNTAFNLRYGLHYMSSDANQFEDNLFSHNVAGAAIMYSKHIEFRRNAFVHNRGFSSFGILFQDCVGCLAEGNFIIDNGTGVFMEAVRESTFRQNVIAENDLALQIFSSSVENFFSANNFVENLSPLQIIGKKTTTHWQVNGHGNFWSEYEGYDLDGDGVGDISHRIQNVFEYMEGNYPRLRLFLSSPAAQALAVAEKTFPVVEGSLEVDTAPLIRAVAVTYPFDRLKPDQSSQLFLGLISLAMLTTSLTVIWRGQRR